MSKYTTEVRFICETYAGLSESEGYTNIDNIISTATPLVFDFDFPIFDESYRTALEKKILLHYYTREIGYETVSRWKLALRNKLNEIMPKYNKLYESELIKFNPLYTHDMYTKRDNTKTEDIDTTDDNTTSDSNTRTLNTAKNGSTSHDITIDDTAHEIPNETNKKLHSDTPQGGLTGVDDMEYLSDYEKTIRTGDNTTSNHHTDLGSGTSNETNTGTVSDARSKTDNRTIGVNAETVDDYLEHVYGYANYNPSKLIKEWRETFLNIDEMVIKELSKLFMGVW